MKDYHKPEDYAEDYFKRGLDSAKEFFDCFDGRVDIKRTTALDVGFGFGSTSIYMALNGARKVVRIEIDEHKINLPD